MTEPRIPRPDEQADQAASATPSYPQRPASSAPDTDLPTVGGTAAQHVTQETRAATPIPAPTGADVTQEMRTSFLEYSYSVIYARALPDARDGLKPVQRRILFQMGQMGLRPDRGHVKSSRAGSIRTATSPSTTRWSGWPSRSRSGCP